MAVQYYNEIQQHAKLAQQNNDVSTRANTHTCPQRYLQMHSVMLHSVTTIQQMGIVNSRSVLLP